LARIEDSLRAVVVRQSMSTDEGSAVDAPESASGADAGAHPNAEQDVIAVDADDEPQGTVNRLEAHTGDGIRHRAFTALVFDTEGRILLAQRSPEKRLWDTHWDGTVASHPRVNQTQKEATRERLVDELGVSADQYRDLRVTDKFEYKRYYPQEGVEWEVCAVLKLTLDDISLSPDESEVAGLLWVDYDHLYEHPRWYRQLRLCPWFEIAMRRDFS
jgi:isopentenyl-diphosphate delta-isomerase